ncbi:MAG: DUF4388 domain-containing protein [Chitinivibrionales bacterium]|nr:DUF4388 domain-containing protein [Chitinivibrionales bacterium]
MLPNCIFNCHLTGILMNFLFSHAFWAISTGTFAGVLTGTFIAMFTLFSRRRNIARDISQTTFVFSGNLQQTSLLDAIQFLEIGRREGVLHIYSGRRKGYITFVAGKVVDAFYRNKTEKEAIFSMLELKEGDFYFEPKKIVQPQLMSQSIIDLTFEWDAQRGESAESG